VGCRGDPSSRRNTAGSWGVAGGRVGRAWMFGEGHGMVEYRKSLVKSASEVVHRGRIGSRPLRAHRKSSIEGASEVAPRIGVQRITHHRHSQRGRGGTRFHSALTVCASSLFVRFTRYRSALKHGKFGAAIEGSHWIGSFFVARASSFGIFQYCSVLHIGIGHTSRPGETGSEHWVR